MAILRVTLLVLLIVASPELMGCSKATDDTSFTEASKGFEKKLNSLISERLLSSYRPKRRANSSSLRSALLLFG